MSILVESGFSSLGRSLPYMTLNKVMSVLDTYDTCANRLENHYYHIITYSDNFSSLLTLNNDVENILDQSTLQVQRRRILRVHFFDKMITEEKPGLYKSVQTYEIIAQKDYRENLYSFDFDDAGFSKKLSALVYEFSTTTFGDSSWKRPFLTVPEYIHTDDFHTTKSRHENTSFGIVCEGYNPAEVETILEEVDNLLSYSRINTLNRRFTHLGWQSSTLEEIEPELWRGQVNFRLLMEKDLV